MHPAWFTEAVAQKPEHHNLEILGKRIHCQTWGDDSLPGLLFVHGHAAHAHWWDFIAPQFQQDYRVAAMDMSGNGDSQHRDQYSASQFAEEIAAVSKWLGTDTLVVAHSFGGSMARIAAHLYPESLRGLILVDSVISSNRREASTPQPVAPPRERIYASIEQAAKRFRLRPPQPRPKSYIQEYIANHSVQQVETGYRFKLDPQVFDKMWPESEPLPDGVSMVENLKVPCGYIYGELSRFCPAEAIVMLKALFPAENLIGIPEAYHHVFLDQPEEFVVQLRLLLNRLS